MIEEPKQKLKKEYVVAEIGAIKDNIYILGGNDYEIPVLMQLMEDVKTEKIEPEEALTKAHFILNSKQDYH